ncbi:MAG: hypothetical protein H6Q89_2173 [Myxococcaceae bacterium]|nr:hypothetical protein [Myxococcaceae bacterium]
MRTRATTKAELAIDGAAIVAVSVGICTFSHQIPAMTALVVAAWFARTVAWSRLRPRHGLGTELAFSAIATGVGAFNDWNSVDGHRIYDYAVPTDLAGVSSLPLWMLLYWGLILRFLATLALCECFGSDPSPRPLVRVGPFNSSQPWVKIAAQLALVVATRQAIYRAYLDPVLSWLPFLAAGAVHFAIFGWDHRERRLVALALVIGPLVEILYIQVGGLHRYHLGWLGGVPLWIVLWWAVSLLIWRDLAPRLLALLQPRPVRATRESRPT